MKKYHEKQLRKQLLEYYSHEKLSQLEKLQIERKNIMPRHATIYEWELVDLIKLHKKSIEDAQDDVNYFTQLNVDDLVSYYKGRIVSLELSLNQLRNLRKSLFSK